MYLVSDAKKSYFLTLEILNVSVREQFYFGLIKIKS
jgi:hypothetical protein